MGKRAGILKKISYALFTAFMVITFNFFLFRAMPGTGRISLGKLGEILGLHDPLHVQFLRYLGGLLRGDLGISFQHRQPVLNLIMDRVPATLLLVGLGTALAIGLGVLLAAFVASRRGTRVDVAGLSLALVLYSMPAFWLGIFMLMFFAVYLRWFPTSGMRLPADYYASTWEQALAILRHLFLPLLTFTLGFIGQYALIMRSSLLEILEEDYVTSARAKGLTQADIMRKHVIPNAMLPVTTLIAINLGFVVGGAIQVETIFSWPGLGRLTYAAVTARDFPLLQGIFLFVTMCVILANLMVDFLYSRLDPRVRR